MKYLILFLTCIFAALLPVSGKTLTIGVLDDCGSSSSVHASMNYVKSALSEGYIVYVLPRTEDHNVIRRLLKNVDILLLTGGEDVAPWRYGAEASPKLGGVNEGRDACEFAVLKVAAEMKKPTFGTCRGVQVINAFFGGTLWQDIPSEIVGARNHRYTNPETGLAHVIKIDSKSRLRKILGVDTAWVNSYHHQAVQRLAPGFRIAALSDDGIVEAIECDSLPVVGVQFHPEAMIQRDSQCIFKKLYKEMKRWTKK